MSYEVITVDALKGCIAPVHVRILLHEMGRRELPNPEWAQAHPIQRLVLTDVYQSISIIEAKELSEEARADIKAKRYPMTIGGIPLRENSSMPDDVIEFYQGTDLVGRIFNLAKPPGL